MERRKTIFDYVSHVLIIFGFMMLVMNLFCLLVGEQAWEYSALFSLGAKGLSVETVFEFLAVAVLIVFLRMLFFTDVWIKKMSITLRTVCMVGSVIAVIAVFVIAFRWFPVDLWQAWAMFLLCFAISFALSLGVMVLREKTENRQMEQALEKLKEREGV